MMSESDLRLALEVIATALNDSETGHGGSYWPARQWLASHDVYADDLDDLRVLYSVARTALGPGPIEAEL